MSHDSIRGRVRPSVGPSVGNAFVSAGRDEPANDLFRVYELVFLLSMVNLFIFALYLFFFVSS